MSAPARPRPRPRPRATTSSSENTKQSSTDGSVSATKDLDAMFMRNTDFKAYKAFEKKAEVVQKKTSSPSKKHGYSDSDDDDSGSQSPSPRSRQKARKKSELPAWAKKDGKKVLNAISLSDDEEEEMDKDDADDSLVIHRTPVMKKKKIVKRSPSITPPPPVSMQQLQIARNLVRQTFDASRSSPPVIDVDDDDEPNGSFELAPELVAIATSNRLAGPAHKNNASAESSTAPQVTLTIKWIPHPMDDEGEIQAFQFRMRQDESFASLFSDLADEAGVLEDNMVMTCNGKKVFASATPHSLGIWSAAELEAYTLNVYDHIQNKKRERALSPNIYNHEVETSAGPSYVPEESGAMDSASETEDGPQDTFKLTLRSGATQSVTVTVRPSTKCSSIISSFLKKTGRPPTASKKARISVDGESLDPNDPIEVAGLEDGDVADIVGI